MKKLFFGIAFLGLAFLLVGCDDTKNQHKQLSPDPPIEIIDPKPEDEVTITLKYPDYVTDEEDKITTKKNTIFGDLRYGKLLEVARKRENVYKLVEDDFFIDNVAVDDNYRVVSDLTLTSTWEVKSFNVFILNNLTNKIEEELTLPGNTLMKKSFLEKRYLSSAPWQYETVRKGEKKVFEDSFLLSDDTFFYSDIYKRTNHVVITLDLNNHLIEKELNPIIIPFGSSIKELPNVKDYVIIEETTTEDTVITYTNKVVGWKRKGHTLLDETKKLLEEKFTNDETIYAIWETTKTTKLKNSPETTSVESKKCIISFSQGNELIATECPPDDAREKGARIGKLPVPKYNAKEYFFIGWFYMLSGLPVRSIDIIIEDTTLFPEFKKYPENISGGQIQLKDLNNSVILYVPENITEIDNTFENSNTIKIVYLNKNVRTIKDNAFRGSSINKIVFHEQGQLSRIGSNAFKDCKHLEYVTFTEGMSITTIGEGVFSGCVRLESISIPFDISNSKGILENCENLRNAFLNTSRIPENVFNGCINLIKVENKQTTISIRKNAFNGCRNLYIIPSIVQSTESSIGSNAFSGCDMLTNITIFANKNKVILQDESVLKDFKKKTIIIISDDTPGLHLQEENLVIEELTKTAAKYNFTIIFN